LSCSKVYTCLWFGGTPAATDGSGTEFERNLGAFGRLRHLAARTNPTRFRPQMADNSGESTYIELTANIVSAYVSNNTVATADIANLISQVHAALMRVSGGQVAAPAEALKPAVPVKRSITSDYIVCLEDGKKFKSLKRHLRTQYDMTPEQYRDKWALPPDYPMVAPNYAAARSQLAKQMGLGQQRRRRRERG